MCIMLFMLVGMILMIFVRVLKPYLVDRFSAMIMPILALNEEQSKHNCHTEDYRSKLEEKSLPFSTLVQLRDEVCQRNIEE